MSDLIPIGTPQPSDDSDRTWHVCDINREQGEWGWGIDCERCRGERTGHRGASSNPYFNIEHLKRQNREGVTTAEEVRDVLANVKPEDREKIARAR